MRVFFSLLVDLAALREKHRFRALSAASLYESQFQARIAALIEQSADSSVASSMSEFKTLKLHILPLSRPKSDVQVGVVPVKLSYGTA